MDRTCSVRVIKRYGMHAGVYGSALVAAALLFRLLVPK